MTSSPRLDGMRQAAWHGCVLAAALAGLAASEPALAQQTVAVTPSEAQGGAHHATVDADVYPWSSVAKLFNSVGGSCTGAVIARDEVLTAGHCLYAFRTRRFLPPEAIHVLLGYDRGDYRVHARVARYRLGPGYDPQVEQRSAASDWAVLHLAEPLPGSVEPLPLSQLPASDKAAIMVGGFARDKAYMMTADDHCVVTGSVDGGRLIAHDCVIAPGDSGAPLLISRGPKQIEVVGVAVGIWHVGSKAVAIAAPISPSILAGAVPPP